LRKISFVKNGKERDPKLKLQHQEGKPIPVEWDLGKKSKSVERRVTDPKREEFNGWVFRKKGAGKKG